jgi:hypothetical protein
MPAEPTMADVANHLRALHDCVHDGQQEQTRRAEEVRLELREHRHESRNNAQKVQIQFGQLGERIAKNEGKLEIIGQTVGAPKSAATAGAVGLKFMNLKWWQAVLALGGALAGATGGYKIIASAAKAFHVAMIGG